MVWEIIIFCLLAFLAAVGIGIGLMALHKVNKISDTKELYDAIAKLENRPYVDPSQVKELVLRVTKLDNVTTQQGQVLATVKKSAFQAEEMSKKLAVVYNQTASNKI